MLNDNEKLKRMDDNEIMFKLEEFCSRDIVSSHHSNERKGASIDTEMVQHAAKAYVIRCWSYGKQGHITSKCRLEKTTKRCKETVLLVEVSELHNVFVTENGNTVVDLDDNKEITIDEANYLDG